LNSPCKEQEVESEPEALANRVETGFI